MQADPVLLKLLHVLVVGGLIWGVIIFVVCALFYGAKKRNG